MINVRWHAYHVTFLGARSAETGRQHCVTFTTFRWEFNRDSLEHLFKSQLPKVGLRQTASTNHCVSVIGMYHLVLYRLWNARYRAIQAEVEQKVS